MSFQLWVMELHFNGILLTTRGSKHIKRISEAKGYQMLSVSFSLSVVVLVLVLNLKKIIPSSKSLHPKLMAFSLSNDIFFTEIGVAIHIAIMLIFKPYTEIKHCTLSGWPRNLS